MPQFDKDYWIELLEDVHRLVSHGLDNCNWTEWATGKLKAIGERGCMMPVQLAVQEEEAILQSLRSELEKHPKTEIPDILDGILHGLRDGTMDLDKKREEQILYLLLCLRG